MPLNIAGRLTLAFVVALVLALGCENRDQGGPNLASAREVTLAQLSVATSSLPIIHYLGSDTEYHYLRGDEQQYFRLPRTETAADFPVFDHPDVPIGSVAVFLTIRDGKLVPPLPDDLVAAGYGEALEP